ncbi:Hypothetical protein POVR1_LOCUS535 [uncultured virus]|nr:Hypothetical protein POVR1_LOCUS535 [uncultured virus]
MIERRVEQSRQNQSAFGVLDSPSGVLGIILNLVIMKQKDMTYLPETETSRQRFFLEAKFIKDYADKLVPQD